MLACRLTEIVWVELILLIYHLQPMTAKKSGPNTRNLCA